MKYPWSLMPLLWPAAAFAGGILCGDSLCGRYFIAAAVVCAVMTALARHYVAAAIAAAFAFGAAEGYYLIPREARYDFVGKSLAYKGDVMKVRTGDSSQTLTVRIRESGAGVDSLKEITPFDADVTVPSFVVDYEPWHTMVFAGKFELSDTVRDLPDEMSPGDMARERRVFLRAVVAADSVVGYYPAHGLMARLHRVRTPVSYLLLQSSLMPETKEFLCTALLGDASALSNDVRADFASAGLAHVLALSGLHVGLIALLVTLVLWPLRMTGATWPGSVAVIVLLWLYAVVAGMSPSVVRAVCMLSVYTGATLFQRINSGFNSLCCAALIVMIIDPMALYSVGFQLSFAAVASILLLGDTLNPVPRRNRIWHSLAGYVSVSLAAVLGTGLISCIYFHDMPVYFLLSNIAVSLLLPWLIGGGMVLLVAEWAGFDPLWLCSCIDFMYDMVAKVAEIVAGMPNSTIRHIYIPAWTVVPYVGVIACVKLWTVKHKKMYGVAAAFFVAATILCIYPADVPKDVPRIYLARGTYHTDLPVYAGGTSFYLITTATPAYVNSARYRAERRYVHFMGKRGIDSVTMVVDSLKLPCLSWHKPWLEAGDAFVAIISSLNQLSVPARKVDYAVICRGYTGNMKLVADILAPDSVVLSYDLHPKRAVRYKKECAELGVPYRCMRDGRVWSLPLVSVR